MILYYKSYQLTAKLTVDKKANLKQVDALMANDGLTRCTRKEWLAAKNRGKDSSPSAADPLGIAALHEYVR